ncbi:unnamed protein product [Rhizophagus irregularis]|nr:unnamed protein product [Rhizophagus irregularis]
MRKTLFKVTQSYEKTPVKYENMKEIRNGYLDLDLLKNDNIKKYIGCSSTICVCNEKVYLNPAPVESLTFLGFNENESANIFLKRRERPFDRLDDRVDFALSINGHP